MSAQIPRKVPLTPRLAARLVRRTRNDTNSCPDSTGRCLSVPELARYLQTLKEARQTMQHVLAACRFGVSPGIMRKVLDKYRRTQSGLMHMPAACIAPQSQGSMRFAIDEIVALGNSGGWYDPVLKMLCLPVEPFELSFRGKRHAMGPYILQMAIGELANASVAPGLNAPYCSEGLYYHPHVGTNSSFCMGAHREYILGLLRSGLVTMAAANCLKILHAYNHDNPYKGLDKWDYVTVRQRCQDCGGRYEEGIMYQCACDEPKWFCPNCTYLDRGRAICNDCGARCTLCGFRSRKDHGTILNGNFHCANCVKACTDCGKVILRTEVYHANCNEPLCIDCFEKARCVCGHIVCKFCRTVKDGQTLCSACAYQPQPQGVSA